MMDNPFTHSRIVTGESFCNRQQEIKDLAYWVQNNQNPKRHALNAQKVDFKNFAGIDGSGIKLDKICIFVGNSVGNSNF